MTGTAFSILEIFQMWLNFSSLTPLIQSGDNWKTLNNFKPGVSKEWQCYLPFSTHLNPHSCFVLVGLGHNARCVGLNNMFFKTLLPLLLLVPGFYFQSQVGIMYHPKIKTEKKLLITVTSRCTSGCRGTVSTRQTEGKTLRWRSCTPS